MTAVGKYDSTAGAWAAGGVQGKDSPKPILNLSGGRRCNRPPKFCHMSGCRTEHSMRQPMWILPGSFERLLLPFLHWQALTTECLLCVQPKGLGLGPWQTVPWGTQTSEKHENYHFSRERCIVLCCVGGKQRTLWDHWGGSLSQIERVTQSLRGKGIMILKSEKWARPSSWHRILQEGRMGIKSRWNYTQHFGSSSTIPGIVLSILEVFPHSILIVVLSSGFQYKAGTIITPIVQMKKLRHRKIRSYAQGSPAKWKVRIQTQSIHYKVCVNALLSRRHGLVGKLAAGEERSGSRWWSKHRQIYRLGGSCNQWDHVWKAPSTGLNA